MTRRLTTAALALLVTAAATHSQLAAPASAQPYAEDVSPNNLILNGRESSAGFMIGLAGDDNVLYAVSPNAGIWRSDNRGPWVQLLLSPRYANSIVQDPNDAAHLLVGERNGDAVNPAFENTGVWETLDGGLSWRSRLVPSCQSRAVPAVAFSRISTWFAATTCGLIRDGGQVTLPAGGGGPGYNGGDRSILAVTTSANTVWARTLDTLLISTNDGITWTAVPIPRQCDTTNACAVDIPDSSTTSPMMRLRGDRGDDRSLAAFDGFAVISVQSAVPEPRLPQGAGTCDLLVYRPAHDPVWSLQRVADDRSGGNHVFGSGIGLGGRRFLRAFDLNRPDLSPTVGQRRQLIYSAAQDVTIATGVDASGIIQWKSFAVTTAAFPQPVDALYKNRLHPDMWDVRLSPDGTVAWIADDGGVHENRLTGDGWVARIDGLHTHHIHMLNVLPTQTGRSRILYPTGDNDGWDADSAGVWRNTDGLGDANWSVGDPGNPDMALVWRLPRDGTRPTRGSARLTAFGSSGPTGARDIGAIISLNTDLTFDGPLFFQFLPTQVGESPTYPLLDAVMLTKLPLQYFDANGNLVPVPGVLGTSSGGPVLVRNRQFAANPDINKLYRGSYANSVPWLLEGNPPANTKGFWASGGHAEPVYYAMVEEGNTVVLYRRDAGAQQWYRLPISGLLREGSSKYGVHGPAFINPWDAEQLYALTDRGVQVSNNGGRSFSSEEVLTRLITGNGKYPLRAAFPGADETDVDGGSGTRAAPMGTLSHMAFDRDHPHAVVAASPYTGVFYNPGDGSWRDLTAYLPTGAQRNANFGPFAPVSAVGIDREAVYAATEGRSLVRIVGGAAAPGISGCAHPSLRDGAPCSDNDECTTNDRCQNGTCVGGPPPDCNAGLPPCEYSPGCHPVDGCIIRYREGGGCDDGNPCTTNDFCCSRLDVGPPCNLEQKCVGGPAPDCNDDNVCTTDSCNPATGCMHTNLLSCLDNDVCTVDKCNRTSGCQHTTVANCAATDSNEAFVGGPNKLCTNGAADATNTTCTLSSPTVDLRIPFTALSEPTHINIVSTPAVAGACDFALRNALGKVVSCIQLEPSGTPFGTPVTATFKWTNVAPSAACPTTSQTCCVNATDASGPTALLEGSLKLYMHEQCNLTTDRCEVIPTRACTAHSDCTVELTPNPCGQKQNDALCPVCPGTGCSGATLVYTACTLPCTPPATCEPAANSWTVKLSHFSEYALGFTPPPPDHFQCYKSRLLSRTPLPAPLTLVDRFGTVSASVIKPLKLCSPTDKDGEDPDAVSHANYLQSYGIELLNRRALDARLPVRGQNIVDTFGTHTVDVRLPDRFLVPTTENVDSQPLAPDASVLDHFTCYKVKQTKGTPRFAKTTVTVVDQFDQFPQTITLKKPAHLCVPSDKNGEQPGAEDNRWQLMCYRASRPFVQVRRQFTNNELGPSYVYPLFREEVCVPALLD